MKRQLLSLLLALSLLTGLSAPALAAETASVIRLTKTTGTVEISKSSGKSISLLKNMRLYNGYHVATEEESYAWINLDDARLLKEDAASEIEVRKDGKKLEVLISSGNVFFDVAEPLEDDESLNIRTSTMVVGIRGTSGWVQISNGQVTRVSILEGETECSVSDPVTGQVKTDTVRGGEWARGVVYDPGRQGDQCDIIKEKFTVDDIPGYVLTDVVRDVALCDKIKENTGLDILGDLAAVAGGDPSGRTPDGESASPEVLGIADRREDEDEADLRERLETVERDLERQEQEKPLVSPDKALEKEPEPAPPTEDDGDDGDDGGGDDPAPTPDPEPEPEDPTPPTPPDPTPPTYTITFDANGGTIGGDPSTIVTTGENGIAPWPSDPVYGDPDHPPVIDATGKEREDPNQLEFQGWYDAPSGGTQYTASSAFSANTTLYAQWEGWFFDSETKTLVVSGSPGENDYTQEMVKGTAPSESVFQSSAPWGVLFVDAVVEAIEIKEGTGRIGDRAFWAGIGGNGSILASVMIPASVTTIGDLAFADHYGLTSVTIPDSVTSIGNSAFSGCSGLTSVTIPSGVTSIGDSAFYRCSGLTSLTIPEGVASIGDFAFGSCTNLTELILPDSVASLGEGFINGCEKLSSIDLPSGLTSIGDSAFQGCYLDNVTIPEGVTSIGNSAFWQSNVLNVVLPSGVTSIGESAFESCGSLRSITIPSTVNSIGGNAFHYCNSLATIHFTGTTTEWNALKDKSTDAKIPTGVTVICSDGNTTT